MICLAAALGYLMIHQQDPVGLVTFDTAIRHSLPPRSKRTQLGAMLSLLAAIAGAFRIVSLGDYVYDYVYAPHLISVGLVELLTGDEPPGSAGCFRKLGTPVTFTSAAAAVYRQPAQRILLQIRLLVRWLAG